jgi:hypothetical protein
MILGGEWNLPAVTLSIGTEYLGFTLFSHGGDVRPFSVSLDDEHGLIINAVLLPSPP